MIQSGELQNILSPYIDSIILPKIDSFENEVNTKILQQNAKIMEQDNELVTLNNRINNIAHLDSGSTTADAELIDIRVAFDGKIYKSIQKGSQGSNETP